MHANIHIFVRCIHMRENYRGCLLLLFWLLAGNHANVCLRPGIKFSVFIREMKMQFSIACAKWRNYAVMGCKWSNMCGQYLNTCMKYKIPPKIWNSDQFPELCYGISGILSEIHPNKQQFICCNIYCASASDEMKPILFYPNMNIGRLGYEDITHKSAVIDIIRAIWAL